MDTLFLFFNGGSAEFDCAFEVAEKDEQKLNDGDSDLGGRRRR